MIGIILIEKGVSEIGLGLEDDSDPELEASTYGKETRMSISFR